MSDISVVNFPTVIYGYGILIEGFFFFFWCISALIYHRHCQCESRNMGHFPANLGNMNRTGPVRTELSSRRVRGREKGRLSSRIVPRLSVRPHTRTGRHLSFFFLTRHPRTYLESLPLLGGLKRVYNIQMLRP